MRHVNHVWFSNLKYINNYSYNSLYILNSVRNLSIDGKNKSSNNKTNIFKKKDTSGALLPAYIPREVEHDWYDWWEGQGYFSPQFKSEKRFSLVLPPPNVTGTLHLGHALTCTIQDVLARWHRMRGEQVLWVPGTDHAGISTQVIVEKKLLKERGLTRHDLGREKFLQEVWKWREDKSRAIKEQLRKLGASLDWSRETFTMDAKQCDAVKEAFMRLFEAGLVYRANSLVNWSCVLQSAISDIEVEHRHFSGSTLCKVPGYDDPVEFGVISDFAYKLCDRDGEIVVSTTRIETMLGDVAVAVHPSDMRYKHLQGVHLWHPFQHRKIPLIFDEVVDVNFGTGAVKITPAHDMIDLEVSKRHGLDSISVITEEGRMESNCGVYSGMKRFEARSKLLEDLHTLKLFRGKRDHSVQVPFCTRSEDVVELLLKPQWFIRCKQMAEEAAAAVQDGQLQLEPAYTEKIWYNWLYNNRDWCVSRQLWWGHRIPMYHCQIEDKSTRPHELWVAALSEDHARKKATLQLHLDDTQAHKLIVVQDEDVLDTWFSSALFPFSALGWPDQDQDYRQFYPLSVLETGHDILFFWVARMVMLGARLTHQIPFQKVLLHGILCDAHGRKMSKSLGNVISPENVITGISLEELQQQSHASVEAGLLSQEECDKAVSGQAKLFPKGIPECGTDALRFTLASHNVKNHQISFDVSECHTNRLLCNKLWQATKYTLMCLDKATPEWPTIDDKHKMSIEQRWVLSRLGTAVAEVNTALEKADFHSATQAIRTFLHYELCDIYLESTKLAMKDSVNAPLTCGTLVRCLETTLLCLSPFMPYITEELYQRLPLQSKTDSIMVALYPCTHEWSVWRDEEVESEVQLVLNVVSAIRSLRSRCGTTDTTLTVHVVSKSNNDRQVLAHLLAVMKRLSKCHDIIICTEDPSDINLSTLVDTVGPTCSVYLTTQVGVFRDDKKWSKKQARLLKELEKLVKRTSSIGYKEKTPSHVQKFQADKMKAIQLELEKMQELHK